MGCGGGERIRTSGPAMRDNRFQDDPIQPLWHSSELDVYDRVTNAPITGLSMVMNLRHPLNLFRLKFEDIFARQAQRIRKSFGMILIYVF